jgi:hypothetical protein
LEKIVTLRQHADAVRILREQIGVRHKQNELIRTRFGDRITIALTAECAYREREIEALEQSLTLVEAVVPEAA